MPKPTEINGEQEQFTGNDSPDEVKVLGWISEENEMFKSVEIDDDLKTSSEKLYQAISQKIVNKTLSQLTQQNKFKTDLKRTFTRFFIGFLIIQYVFLICMLMNNAGFSFFVLDTSVSDAIIIAYISSVFVETLGAIVLMIRYAFNSDQEEKILEILNQFMSHYQKLK